MRLMGCQVTCISSVSATAATADATAAAVDAAALLRLWTAETQLLTLEAA
jgi:hypothetical protein